MALDFVHAIVECLKQYGKSFGLYVEYAFGPLAANADKDAIRKEGNSAVRNGSAVVPVTFSNHDVLSSPTSTKPGQYTINFTVTYKDDPKTGEKKFTYTPDPKALADKSPEAQELIRIQALALASGN